MAVNAGLPSILWWRCWSKRGVAGMLRCWWGSGRVLVAVRDDEGGGCIVLLGRRGFQGVRAVAGMGQQAWRCRGRRTAVTELTTMTRTADNAARGEGWRTTASDESSCSMMQGDDNGSNNCSGDVTLRASYSQQCPLRVLYSQRMLRVS